MRHDQSWPEDLEKIDGTIGFGLQLRIQPMQEVLGLIEKDNFIACEMIPLLVYAVK